jgi:hypothetical protein
MRITICILVVSVMKSVVLSVPVARSESFIGFERFGLHIVIIEVLKVGQCGAQSFKLCGRLEIR